MDIKEHGIFLNSYNDLSGRTATLFEKPFVAYLYLSESYSKEIQYGTIAYMLIDPTDEEYTGGAAEQLEPLLLSKHYSSYTAVLKAPEGSDYSLQWSQDGESVALLYKNEPIVMASGHDDKGHSKAVIKVFDYANPWDQDVYDERFNT